MCSLDILARLEELSELVSPELKFPRRARELLAELAEYARRTGDYLPADEATMPPDLLWMYIYERAAAEDGPVTVLRYMPLLETCLGAITQCRECGCTWDNACEGGCHWVKADLCSRCAGR